MGRDIIQYIDIHDTSSGHIEIADRMRPIPIYDYPRRGTGSHNVEISYNHYQEVSNIGGTHQKNYLYIFWPLK